MKIILGITGSISAYKSIDLARSLVNSKHEVIVVLSEGAKKFVVPEIFGYLGAHKVYQSTDDFNHNGVLHVDIARWADKFIIAPLSANTLSKLAQGSADDLLSSLFLAFEKTKPILVFPAMNTEMLSHPFTQENFKQLEKLYSLDNLFISPTDIGKLACLDIGSGKLPSIDEICELAETIEIPVKSAGKKVIISTGATISPLDPVRYLTNSSSGITGYFLAKTFLKLGYEVVVIAGINSVIELNRLSKHPRYQLIRTTTVESMSLAIHREIKNANLFISSAAVTDIEFDYNSNKMKKSDLNNSLTIKHAKDILKSVIDLKIENLIIVGFAAETNLSDEILNNKFEQKPVHLLVGTKVNNGTVDNKIEGFNNDFAYYRLMNKNGFIFEGEIKKQDLGFEIIKNLKL